MIGRTLLAGLAVLAPAPAVAHGFAGSGWLHPLTGPDHMLAMVLVGAWSAQLGGRGLSAVPAAFVAAMAAGALTARAGLVLPGTEAAIAASGVALGVAVALARPVAVPFAATATLVFGWAHGAAHGVEMPAAAGIDYAIGFLVTTAGLHAAGLAGAGLLLDQERGPSTLRVLGTAGALGGLAFLLPVLA
ncbi:HupE/UreJ family protein [Amorphus coralli]|uniref:HupE/UreJ family protein n=1 Tax=Amorphus coralli TaxID=340680 RepID=UPI00036BD74E|nr:HupE/UreJ family protein [Amorphus coralli]